MYGDATEATRNVLSEIYLRDGDRGEGEKGTTDAEGEWDLKERCAFDGDRESDRLISRMAWRGSKCG